MMATVGYILLYSIPGIIASWLWTLPIQLAGAPGALLAMGRNGVAKAIGGLLCFAGQAYASLAWVGLVVGVVRALLSTKPHLWGLLLYPAAFFVAVAPIAKGARESMQTEAEDPEVRSYVQHQVVGLTAFVTAAGFAAFAVWPNLIPVGWAWLRPVIRALV
jgi:hypothetical protein